MDKIALSMVSWCVTCVASYTLSIPILPLVIFNSESFHNSISVPHDCLQSYICSLKK